jgi:hypothetical protein
MAGVSLATRRTAESTTLCVLVPTETRAALERLARLNERSLSGEVRVALARHVEGARPAA